MLQALVLYCDNQSVLCIASIPVYYESKKHLKVDCHLKIEISTRHIEITTYLLSRELVIFPH